MWWLSVLRSGAGPRRHRRRRPPLPALAGAARGGDPDLAIEAIRALSKVSPDGCAAVIAGGLRHGDGRVRDAALGALWSLESRAAPALASLREVAADETSPDLAHRAAELVSILEASETATVRDPAVPAAPVAPIESR